MERVVSPKDVCFVVCDGHWECGGRVWEGEEVVVVFDWVGFECG